MASANMRYRNLARKTLPSVRSPLLHGTHVASTGFHASLKLHDELLADILHVHVVTLVRRVRIRMRGIDAADDELPFGRRAGAVALALAQGQRAARIVIVERHARIVALFVAIRRAVILIQ